jgi:hypothetical protein
MTDQEANAMPAGATDMRVGDVSAFCVISTTVNNDYGRTWKKDKAAAVAHAKKLIRNSPLSNGVPKCRKLFVVQVVEVVEVPGPAISTRSVTADDIEDLNSGE